MAAVDVVSVQVKGQFHVGTDRHRESGTQQTRPAHFRVRVDVGEEFHGAAGGRFRKSGIQGRVLIVTDLRHISPLGIEGQVAGDFDPGIVRVMGAGTVRQGVPAEEGAAAVPLGRFCQDSFSVLNGDLFIRSRPVIGLECNRGTAAAYDRFAAAVQIDGITVPVTAEVGIAAVAGEAGSDLPIAGSQGNTDGSCVRQAAGNID